MTTHTVCRVEELPVGQHRLFTAGETKLIVYHLDDGFFATQASLHPHLRAARQGQDRRRLQDPVPLPPGALRHPHGQGHRLGQLAARAS